MVFSTEVIQEATSKSLYRKQPVKDFNFVVETTNFLIKEEIELNHLLSLSEEYLCEGLAGKLAGKVVKKAINKIDPKKILISILNRFIQLIERMWNKFNSLMLNLLSDNRVVSVFKKKLENNNEPIQFKEDRYIYTNLGTATSYTTYKNELDKEFSNLILNLTKLHDFDSIEELYANIQNMKNDIDNTDNYYDSVRGSIVGYNGDVTADNFVIELNKFFRNGGVKIPAGDVSADEVKQCLHSYLNYSTIAKSIKKDKENLKKASINVQKDINNINIDNYIKESLPEDGQKMFLSVLESKCNRVNKLCAIYSQVFSVKLETVKESYAQHSRLLSDAVKYLVANGK